MYKSKKIITNGVITRPLCARKYKIITVIIDTAWLLRALSNDGAAFSSVMSSL